MIETQALQFLQVNIFILFFNYQKNLLNNIMIIFLNNSYDYYMKYLETNFHKKFKNIELKIFLWKIIYIIIIKKFNKILFNMRIIDIYFINWFLNHILFEYWIKFYFLEWYYEYFIFNIIESLNSWFFEIREMSILMIFEYIHY